MNSFIRPFRGLFAFFLAWSVIPLPFGVIRVNAEPTPAAQGCAPTITVQSLPFSAVGGTTAIPVTATPGCAWTAVSNSPFITITSGASGTGNGTVQFSVKYNNGQARSGTLTVAGQTVTVTQPARTASTPGQFRPSNGFVYLRNSNETGFANNEFFYGTSNDVPVAGDWNGDGRDSIGIFRNGTFFLRNSNSTGFADVEFAFGAAGDVPIAGDWNGDGIDTVGLVRGTTVFLRNSNTTGAPDVTFTYGVAGDVPIAGDWNGDGVDTIGAYRPSNGFVYLRNANTTGFANLEFFYGTANDRPVVGDWDGDGVDTIGIVRGNQWFLRNTNTTGFADVVYAYGTTTDIPIAGDWDGQNVNQIGQWRERILTSDGAINPSEYIQVANNYNTSEIIDYRLGPTASDFNDVTARPRVWGPSDLGLWPFGTQPQGNPGEPNKCVTSEFLPRSEQEEQERGFRGNGWQLGGQYLFNPDPTAPAQFRYGMSNIRTFDGNVFDTGGLCMRQRASWEPDWWNRNNISRAATPEVETYVNQTSAPLPAVAIARPKGNVGQVGFAAFRNGRIVTMRAGNSVPDTPGGDVSGIQLPPGMVPTAMVVSAFSEFLFVTVWDTNTISGKLAVIALRPRQQAVGAPFQTPNTRYYWGLPGAWTVTGMKILGFVDLPFAAPTSVDVYNNVIQGNPRGFGDNDDPAVGDLSRQSARDLWFNARTEPFFDSDTWRQNDRYGYVVVASRAEGKVSFVNLAPLFQFYRTMYMTTQANYDQTTTASWPFTFAQRPEQIPTIATTVNVPQPTAVKTGQLTTSALLLSRTDYFVEFEGGTDRRYAARRAYIATMDGQVRVFDVSRLIQPNRTEPIQQISSFPVGRNPVSFAETGPEATAPDDLFVISRGDRSVTYAFPDGRIQGVLRDSRMEDPVGGTVGINYAGFYGRGPGIAVFALVLTVADYNGRSLTNFCVDAKRINQSEQYPFTTPTGPAVFLFGFRQPTPGRPLAVSIVEII
jgi:hypothetical protein